MALKARELQVTREVGGFARKDMFTILFEWSRNAKIDKYEGFIFG
jgi:hypothetical protein